ncbi:hypothetical protein FNV43_RR13038 [Rhamnella rubrinervis]|uniref:Uncharacterized protein n=1 Tax=Rhamnella rubrinervis TaxID=2594499 RepID=A0A8K0H0A8_9ROSA|nr:hypothetical protein FNV43_RR13038 [Rhamnella rubrinervis]
MRMQADFIPTYAVSSNRLNVWINGLVLLLVLRASDDVLEASISKKPRLSPEPTSFQSDIVAKLQQAEVDVESPNHIPRQLTVEENPKEEEDPEEEEDPKEEEDPEEYSEDE